MNGCVVTVITINLTILQSYNIFNLYIKFSYITKIELVNAFYAYFGPKINASYQKSYQQNLYLT
jgi:hypothetical protein